MRFSPQFLRDRSGIDSGPLPPCHFIAVTMDLAMVSAAERDGELVADLATERPALCEAEVVGVGRLPSADQAGLLRDVTEVIAVADTPRLGEGECGFVDAFAVSERALPFTRGVFVCCDSATAIGLRPRVLVLAFWRKRCEPDLERLFDVERVLVR
jgi:hypothetical protein